jgi:hypothetical protein
MSSTLNTGTAILRFGTLAGQHLPVAHRGLLHHALENTMANDRA